MDDSKDLKPFIRQEIRDDYKEVFQLLKEAFAADQYSDHKEQYLVDRLRKSSHFIPELSLVAKVNEKIIGYILMTQAGIENKDSMHPTLALAPIAVHPDYQNQGIGKRLINYAHAKAIFLGHESIVLIGHQNYYPKFGYQLAMKFGVRFPFDVPEINRFVLELKKGALEGISGDIVYAREFYED